MKGFKGFYKNNRVYVILMIVSIVCLVSIFVGVIVYFAKQSSQNPYGDRLTRIENKEIKEDRLTELENVIKENELVKSAKVTVKGARINFLITLNKGVPTDAENIAVKLLEKLSDDEKNLYDLMFQFDSLSEGDDNVFPIEGYKKYSSSTISWTKYSS